MKGCARGMLSDALQVGRDGRVGITGNASVAGFQRVRPSPLTDVGAWRKKGCTVHELWAVAWRPNWTDSRKAWPERFVSAPCTLGSMSSDPHDEATRISNEWSLCACLARTGCAAEAGWSLSREQVGLRKVFPVNWRTNASVAEGRTGTIRRVPVVE